MIQLFEYLNINKKQKDVDFLIPFLDIDRRYCLDPSLLRFTKTKTLLSWDEEIRQFLMLIHQVMVRGDVAKLKKILNIGEAPDAGLGYCREGVAGNGFGKEISKQVIEILSKNDDFRKRGFIRLEELQWLDKDIGPDRISDLVINILKRHIIEYTQHEAKKNNIPVEDVRVNKVFEPNSLEWISIKEKLPINPKRLTRDAVNPHPPLLFLPKEIVKTLPLFLNYDSFYGFIESNHRAGVDTRIPKPKIINQIIKNPKLSEDFIKYRESKINSLYRPDFDMEINKYVTLLGEIPAGSREHSNQYLEVVKNIIGFIFEDLSLYKKEKPSILGEIRRDLIFQNNADTGIFATFKTKHNATHIVIDAKNTNNITSKDVAQISNYLNDDIGRVAFIISRKKDKRLRVHSYAQLKNQNKVILFIADEDLKRWVTGKIKIQHVTGKKISMSPEKSIENMYSDLVSD